MKNLYNLGTQPPLKRLFPTLPKLFWMKVSFVFISFLFTGLQLIMAHPGYGQGLAAKKIHLQVIDEELPEIFKQIESQTSFHFAYNPVATKQYKASVNGKSITVEDALKTVLKGTPFIYNLIGDKILITDSPSHSVLLPLASRLTSNISKNRSLKELALNVTGTVVDEDGKLLIGVNVLVKGTNKGTSTDLDGGFALEEIDENAVLVVSYVGYQTLEVSVAGKSNLMITLSTDSQLLDEVVVTAFGITRKKRDLNYSTQEVDGAQLSKTGNTDVTKGLQGKVAGVTVRQLSGAPGRGTSIRIRGSNSLRGSNNPLFVVDGSPVASNIALAINPNEIENMSVLKGATAAALYGLRASNGVILISTKRGNKNELNKPTISLNSNYTFDRLAVYPETQKIYGQGVNYIFDPYSAFSFGPKISDWGTYTNQLGEQEEARVYDQAKDFFRTGGTQGHNLNVSNKFEKGNFSVGMGYSGQEGIIPNTDFTRLTANMTSDYNITDKIKISTSLIYSKSKTRSFNEEGGSGSLFYAAYNAPVSYDYKNKPTHVEGNPYQQINFRGQHDNIYWILDNSGNNLNQSTLLGSFGVSYDPVKWLNVNYRIGLDNGNLESTSIYGFGSGATGGRTNPPSGGRITEDMDQITNINSTLIASMNHQLTKSLNLEVIAGNEFIDYNNKQLSSRGDEFSIPDLHHLSNASNITSSQYWGRSRSYAFFGNINLSYAKMFSLTATGRNDVVSNMPRNNRSFFYPSIGMGFTFTEALKTPDFLTFGKIRASYAEVGQAGGIYSTSTVYTKASASNFSFPYDGINAFTQSNNLKSSDLKPENTKSWEVGTNLVFFGNHLNLDYTYYSSKSEGQIFSVPITSTTGFTSETRNAGEMINHGHEIILEVKPIISQNFSWSFTTNFSAYTNKVTKLAEGVDEISIGGGSTVAFVVAREGESFPVLKGYGYARDPNGKIVVNSNNPESYNYGMPLRSSSGNIIFGKADPDFEINFLNTVRYKNISFYAQVDWRQGGVVGSGDIRLAKLYGTFKETQFREVDYIIPNSVKGYYDNSGNLITTGNNDIPIHRDYDYWRRTMDGIGEQSVYDASFVRLREVRINYDLPVGFLGKKNIKNASIYLIGRNLWLIKSGVPNYDPELNSSSGNAIGYTVTAYPQISNYGFGINLTF